MNALASLPPCPGPSHGVHEWIWKAVRTLLKDGYSDDAIREMVEQGMTRPPTPSHEIEDAIANAKKAPSDSKKRFARVAFDPRRAEQFAQRFAGDPILLLREKSAVKPEFCSTADYLRHVFVPAEKVVLTNSRRKQGVVWAPHGDRQMPWLPPTGEGAWFLSNPVSGDTLDPVTGLRRRRGEANLASFRHLILESDDVPYEDWLRILVQLPLPLVSLVTAGNFSVHALVRIGCRTKQEFEDSVRELERIMIPLGACRASMTAVRLTRLPGALRGSQRQELLYLNPDPVVARIIDITK